MNHDHERGVAEIPPRELLERDESTSDRVDANVGHVVGELAAIARVRHRRREDLVLKLWLLVHDRSQSILLLLFDT